MHAYMQFVPIHTQGQHILVSSLDWMIYSKEHNKTHDYMIQDAYTIYAA